MFDKIFGIVKNIVTSNAPGYRGDTFWELSPKPDVGFILYSDPGSFVFEGPDYLDRKSVV